MTKRKLILLSLIPAALLVIAVLPIKNYDYYILLRWVVCIIGGYFAIQALDFEKNVWAVTMGIIAILFNPVIPIHLTKEIWRPIDIGCAILFIINIFVYYKNFKILEIIEKNNELY